MQDIGLNNQLRVVPNKNFRMLDVWSVDALKVRYKDRGSGCIATPSIGNYPSTPLIAALAISHSRGSSPLVPVYQRFLFNASLILKRRHGNCLIVGRCL